MKIIQIPKKDKSFRTIYVPNEVEKTQLKSYLRLLNHKNLTHCKYAHGFIQGRSAITAALKHCGFKYTICWDIKDFFDSVTCDMVQEFLYHEIYYELTVDDIPRQGLPTSPLIANLAAVSLDNDIVNYLENLAVYTRYADDLTISFNDKELINHLLEDIPKICSKNGFTLNKKKTRVQSSEFGNRVICGVVVGDEPNKSWATRKVRRRLRAAEHQSKMKVKYREKAKKQAVGLREWCKQKLPVQSLLDHRAINLSFELDIKNRRDKRYSVRNQVGQFPVRAYLQAANYLDTKPSVEKSSAAVRLASTFGYRWRDWIKDLDGQNLHDMIYWLPYDILPHDKLGDRLFEWRKNIPDLFTRLKDLNKIAKNWSKLSTEERKLTFTEILDIVESFNYKRIKNKEFAIEAARHSVDTDDYVSYERRWLKAINNITHLNIPRISFSFKDYYVSILDKKDPRALFVGEYVDCCQHPDGEGENCAWHSVESPNGAILAIEKNKVIIAQSWVWRNEDIIVADNCEALDGHSEILPILYEEWAKRTLGKLKINQVRIGTRGDIYISQTNWGLIKSVEPPAGCYTDARNQAIIGSRQ